MLVLCVLSVSVSIQRTLAYELSQPELLLDRCSVGQVSVPTKHRPQFGDKVKIRVRIVATETMELSARTYLLV